MLGAGRGRLRARAGNRPEGLDRVVLGEPQSSARLRNEGELFSLQSGCAGRGAGDGHSASCAFQGFFTSSALPGPASPRRTPMATSRYPLRGVWGRGAEAGGGRRFVAAAVSCRDATAVGERGTRARRPRERRVPRRLAFGAGAWPPSLFSPPWLGGSRFRHAQKGTLRPTLRRPQSPGSQPGGQRADT